MQDLSSKIADQLPFGGGFTLSKIQSLSPKVLDQLSDEEKEELDTFTNVKRQQEYVTSRLVVRKMAAKLGIDPKVFAIQKDELGQPFGVADGAQYCVSIAHTNQYVFCGLTEEKSIGVDLEPVDRKVPQKLQQRILHPSETALSEVETIRLWTIKEAYIKLRGQGLRLNMNQVLVQRDGGDFFVELNNDKTAKICSFQSQNNWLAIAYYQ